MQPRVRAIIASLAALLLVIACAPSSRIAARPGCATGWRAEWSSDSTLSLCVPPGFERKPDSFATFLRSQDLLPHDRLVVYLDPRSAWERGEIADRWPPSLTTGPCNFPDCATTHSLTVHADTVARVAGRVYVGLVTGGFAGLRRKPSLVAGWDLPGELRLGIHGFSERSAALDTLRIALRTIRLSPR